VKSWFRPHQQIFYSDRFGWSFAVTAFWYEAWAWPRRRGRHGHNDGEFARIARFNTSFARKKTSPPNAAAGQTGSTRSFTVAPGPEAEQLTLAFLRFVELHGRTLVDPRSGCSIATAPGRATETRILTFWNRRAAAEFDAFWRRYRPIYGAPSLFAVQK
jgi:hypothetical protein